MGSFHLLSQMVSHRLHRAYVPKTWKAYRSMFVAYLTFCEFMQLDAVAPALITILTFVEFLAYNGLKYTSILNYISALKSQFKWFDLSLQVFEHPKFKLMLKALERSIPNSPSFKGVFDIPTLRKIVIASRSFEHPLVYRALYLLAFFGFFHISNLLPDKKSNFNIMKQLCRGDVIFEPTRAIIVIKWSKTIQVCKKGTFIVIPLIYPHPLCPVTALKELQATCEWPKNWDTSSSKNASCKSIALLGYGCVLFWVSHIPSLWCDVSL